MSHLSFIEKLLKGIKVECKALGNIAENLNSMRKPIRSGLRETGKIPYYGASGIVDYVKDYIFHGDYLLVSEDGANLIDRNTPIAFSASGKFWVNNHAHVLKFETYVERRFVELYLNSIDLVPYISGAAQPKLNQKNLNSIEIPIPPFNVQAEIVRILDAFTNLNVELRAELKARKQQYAYYREQLLNFKENEVQWKRLGEIAEYSKTRISSELLDEKNYVGVNNLLQDRAGKTESSHVQTEGSATKYYDNDILIGNIRPYLKKIWQANCIGGTNGDVLVIHPIDETVNPKYLYQVLADDKFFNYNMQYAKGAKMPRGDKAKIMEYNIPIPSLAEQDRIVDILDKFDVLTNSIIEGLPCEIELRQKQYEYYREILFNLPTVEGNV